MDVQALAKQAAGAVDADQVIALAQTLVRIDSVAAPNRPHEESVAWFIAARLQSMGFKVTVSEVEPKRLNVIAEWDTGQPGRLLILEGHTDVVTEGDADAWARDPFSGDIEDGKLWGRGSADMKGGLAAAIVAVETVKRLELPVSGVVRLLIPCDEEGMMLGIKRMIQDGHHLRSDGQPADGAIICEPEELELCLHQRGGIRAAIRFHGKQAHGAMPYAGTNPIPWLAKAVLGIQELEQTLQTQVPEHPVLGKPYITPTVITAGSLPQLNVMPAEALLALDIRTIPGLPHHLLHASLKSILERLKREDGCRSSYEIIDDRPWTETPPDASIVSALEQATRIVLARAPRYGGVPGTTDGTFLHAAGVPIVTVGPGDREIPHQVDEFVRLEDLTLSARLYAAAIMLFLNEAPASKKIVQAPKVEEVVRSEVAASFDHDSSPINAG